MAAETRPEQQPLLSSENAPGTNGQQPGESSSAPTADAQGSEDFHSYELRAQRIVTWTLYALLFLVTVGTIIGVLLVSIPMHSGDQPPDVRKSAAIAVLQPEGGVSALGSPMKQLLPRALLQKRPVASKGVTAGRRVVVWSGKGHHADLVYNDLYLFDTPTKLWTQVYSYSPDKAEEDLPVARWKALALYDEGANALIVHGGDPLGAGNLSDIYLDDFWRLDGRDVNKPIWQEVLQQEPPPLDVQKKPKKVKLPKARRAHAGVVLNVRNESTLIIHGGRTKEGELLGDVWATSLESSQLSWRRLFKEAGWSWGKKPVKIVGPEARKGHVAVSVRDDEKPLMLIWGGRNDSDYFHNVWAFDVLNESWEEWLLEGGAAPSGRDHLGAFYHGGLVYIYGGRGGGTYDESSAQGDLWSLNITDRHWKKMIPSGPVPPKRFLYSMDVYTEETASGTDARLVVFGGEGELGCYLNDMWEYSVLENTWTMLSPLSSKKKKCNRLAPDLQH